MYIYILKCVYTHIYVYIYKYIAIYKNIYMKNIFLISRFVFL